MPPKLLYAVGFAATALAADLVAIAGPTIRPTYAAQAQSPEIPVTAQTTQSLTAQAGMVETVLYFETESMAVRIFRNGPDLFMNLYDKETDVVQVNGTPAEIVPSSRDQMVYKNSLGEADRFARINVRGETELEIIAPDGTVVLQEPGFNARVAVPSGETNFEGNNFAPGTAAIVISREYANLRAEPRLGSDILGSAERRELVDVLDRIGNPEDGFIWYQVSYDDITGWIRGDLLQPTQ
jgi:uncharacterized protein YgiM (DUF1202 family)